MTLKTKVNSAISYIEKGKRKRGEKEKGMQESISKLLEREFSFSLSFCAIRPSAVFGTRRKATLHGKGFAWVPDLRSFDKLCEVGVSSYVGFSLCLSTLLMFELNEAVRGRLIGSNAWNRGGKKI